MPVVKTLHNRGANIVIAASAEVLFTPSGEIGGWARRFTNSARRYSSEAAPINKRPRWAHYGKPLKQTMRGTTQYRPGQLRVFSAVGSTAPHAYYVDQGTSDFNAKILPPWTRGGASLYEHTWKPSYRSQPLGKIRVSGQKGQHFFDKGLDRAFAQSHLLDTIVPGPGMAAAELAMPEGIADFLGNTPWSVAFQSQLEEWREWRDRAYRGGKPFRSGNAFDRRRQAQTRFSTPKPRRTVRTADERREQSRKRSQAYRDRKRAMMKKPKVERLSTRQRMDRNADRMKFYNAMVKKYTKVDGQPQYRDGRWYLVVWKKELNDGRGGWDEVSAVAKS